MLHFIGDIQGCDAPLGALLDRLAFSPSRDHLVVLGDLVNRGPASAAVLRRLAALEGSVTCLLGNHDLHLLGLAVGARRPGRRDTLEDLLTAPDRAGLLHWLRHQRLACLAGGWLCVHAGVPRPWDAVATLARAAEVEAALRDPAAAAVLMPALSGDEPALWDDALAGTARLRYIVNALTRMRWCHPDGRLDLEVKEAADRAPPGLLPWFELSGRATATQPVAFGHWSSLGLLQRPALLALDTGCVWGGCLSAATVGAEGVGITQVRCPPP